MNFGILELYCGASGKKGYYNSQEVGLARAMKKLGYCCYIFYPDRDEKTISEEIVEDNIMIVHCPAKTMGVHSKFDWNVLKKYEIQAVQVGSDNQIYAPSVIHYCDKHKIPVYSYIGTVETDSTNKMKKILMTLLFKRNVASYSRHMNFAKTDEVCKQLNKVGVENVEVAPVGLDISVIPKISDLKDRVKEECGLPTDKKILLYVGRIDAYKRPGDMLSVLRELNDSYGVIIGDGSLSESFEKRIVELELYERVKWIRKLPNPDVQKYYYVADYFLNFNNQEIFGMSILEAMYQGCTVIAVHAPGPDMIIENKVSGYLVNNIDEIKNIVIKKQCGKLDADKIKNRIMEYFLWNRTAKIFDNWIRRVTNE